jgi:uncharacterized protein (TIGR02246 family)
MALGFSVPAAAEQQEDLAAIRQVQALQAAAWNQHDARAFANLFAEDGDAVNMLGWWWRGRSEIERKMREGFEFVYAQSTLTITDVDVRILSPGMAGRPCTLEDGGREDATEHARNARGNSTADFDKASRWLGHLELPEYE